MTWLYNELHAANKADFDKIKLVAQSSKSDMDFAKLVDYPKFLNYIPDLDISFHMRALMHEIAPRNILSIDRLKELIYQYCLKYYPGIKPKFIQSSTQTFLTKPREKTEPATFTNRDLADMLNLSREQLDASSFKILNDNNIPYNEYAKKVTRAFLTTGAFDWKDWALTNWGTIWNSNNAHADEDRISIVWESANEPCEKIVRMIFNKTHVPMYYRWSDLNHSCRGGEMIMANEYANNDFIGPRNYVDNEVDVANLEYNITRNGSLLDLKRWKNYEPLNATIKKVMYPTTAINEQFNKKWLNPNELFN